MAARSDNRRLGITDVRVWLVAGVLLVLGCEAERTYPDMPGMFASPPAAGLYMYPPVAQTVTFEGCEGVLSRYRGQRLILCVWSATDPRVVEAVHEAQEVRAQYAGSRLVGINLDAPEVWLSAAVPVLRRAGAQFPCMTAVAGDQARILGRLGLGGKRTGVAYVVLNEQGMAMGTRSAFAPLGRLIPIVVAGATSSPAAAVEPPAKERQVTADPMVTAATDSADGEPAGRLLVVYHLRLVRGLDNEVVRRIDGVGQVEAGDAMELQAGWVDRVALEVASGVKRGQGVAVAPLRWEGAGEAGVLQRISQAVAEGITRTGRRTVGPAEVLERCRSMGIPGEMLESRPGLASTIVGTDYVLAGTVSRLSEGRGP